MSGTPRSPRTIVVLATLGMLSLVSAFVTSIFGEPSPSVRSAGADSFSRSALGHRAFVELLRRTDHRVVVSRHASAERALADGILVLLEPTGEPEQLAAMLATADRVLIVLPKRDGDPGDAPVGWIETDALLGVDEVAAVLETAEIDGTVVRHDRDFVPDEPVGVAAPAVTFPQLVVSDALEPIVAGPDGILLGHTSTSWDSEVWVLSDPDLLANHGLADGPNAALVLSILDRILTPGDVLVIDETLHGHETPPHVFGALGRFPLVLALVHGAFALAVLLWCASRRFGAPLPNARALEPGRLTLVNSTAELLLHGGHSPTILRGYFDLEMRRVARARNLPRGLDADARHARLVEIEARRRPAVRLDDVAAAVADIHEGRPGRELKIIRAARLVHRWRTEMLHGTE